MASLRRLGSLFPSADVEVLKAILNDNNGDLKKTADELKNMGYPTAVKANPNNTPSRRFSVGGLFRKNWGVAQLDNIDTDAELALRLQRQEMREAEADSPRVNVPDELWKCRLFWELLFEDPVFVELFDRCEMSGAPSDFFAAVHALDGDSRKRLVEVVKMFTDGGLAVSRESSIHAGQAEPDDAPFSPTTPGSKRGAKEIVEFAKYLGIDPVKEMDLLWIVDDALNAPLPDGWDEYMDENGNVYYSKGDDSQWEHPHDDHYRQLVRDSRAELLRSAPAPIATPVDPTELARRAASRSHRRVSLSGVVLE